MIEVAISKEVVAYAKKRLAQVAVEGNLGLSKFGSEKARILVGFIGEKIVMDYLALDQDVDTYDFDLVSKNGKRLEVKTITCKFKPKEDYWCTVNSHDLSGVHKQKADYYIFLRILNDFSIGWILGWIPCKEFFDKGEFVAKGKDFKKFKFEKANATILPINQLNKFNADK